MLTAMQNIINTWFGAFDCTNTVEAGRCAGTFADAKYNYKDKIQRFNSFVLVV